MTALQRLELRSSANRLILEATLELVSSKCVLRRRIIRD